MMAKKTMLNSRASFRAPKRKKAVFYEVQNTPQVLPDPTSGLLLASAGVASSPQNGGAQGRMSPAARTAASLGENG